MSPSSIVHYQLSFTNSSRHLNLIDNLTDDFLADHIICLSLIGQAYAVAKHVVSNGTYVLGNDIAAMLDEGIRPTGQGQIDAGAR